jgi:hypothetical protein
MHEKELIIKELNFILDNLCSLELTVRGRQFLYRRINYYNDAIKRLQNSSQHNSGDINQAGVF